MDPDGNHGHHTNSMSRKDFQFFGHIPWLWYRADEGEGAKPAGEQGEQGECGGRSSWESDGSPAQIADQSPSRPRASWIVRIRMESITRCGRCARVDIEVVHGGITRHHSLCFFLSFFLE